MRKTNLEAASLDKGRWLRDQDKEFPPFTPGAESDSPSGRLFAVLDLTADMGMVSAADIVHVMGVPRPTAHRLISSLETLGYLQRTPIRGKYAASSRLVRLSNRLMASTAVYAPIKALLASLSQRTGEAHQIAVMSRGEVEYFDVMERSTVTLHLQPGQHAPLYCTVSGAVFLAAMDDQMLEDYLSTGPWPPLTPYSITEPSALRSRVLQVRSRGYALTESEFVLGVIAAAVPVRNAEGRVVASLGLRSSNARKTIEEVAELVPAMLTYASRIGKLL